MDMPNFSLDDQVFFDAAAQFQTPFHLYTEAGIRQTARALKTAFSGVPEFREYFAVKALPTPAILRILKDEGYGVDCASMTELMLAEACGFHGGDIMFSANDVPPEEFAYARALNAHINLDDLTHVEVLEHNGGIPEEVCLRFNPGGTFRIGNTIMGDPGEAKYGMTRAQLSQALSMLKQRGARRFGLHSFLSSNTTDPAYYPALARLLFQTGLELTRESGLALSFINLSGGIGIPYRPGEPAADIFAIGAGVSEAYHEIFTQNGLTGVAIKTELGRYMTGPNGWLVTHILNEKHIYKHYLGLDASACDLMRPAMYGAYHHITLPGKEHLPHDEMVDVTGSLCENNDKFAIDRMLPKAETGDLLVIHDTGAHGLSMGYNYNGKLRCKEVLYREDGFFELIRRAETPRDYFATLDIDPVWNHLEQRWKER
ncbi:MAG: diaminopimelate decarboxylase [Clostridiales bacterium]|nr:diaminopimelate decarboxylase [Clostridiales bacterium]MDY4008894.1 diaminopimelate decarboxylase [Candidatus Limiplasma sp.]